MADIGSLAEISQHISNKYLLDDRLSDDARQVVTSILTDIGQMVNAEFEAMNEYYEKIGIDEDDD